MGSAALIIPAFSPYIKGFQRPIGYAFSDSPAYYKNLLNELEASTKDAFSITDLSAVFAKATSNNAALLRMQRHNALLTLLKKCT